MSGLSLASLRSPGRSQYGSTAEENHDTWSTRRSSKMQMHKHCVDMPNRDVSYRNSLNSHVPHFQGPLRKQVASRASASRSHRFDYDHVLSNDMHGYTDGLASLKDVLSEGLSPNSDWAARVAAFNFIQILLQQGQKGIQDITQHFEKVMKLFLRHMDDLITKLHMQLSPHLQILFQHSKNILRAMLKEFYHTSFQDLPIQRNWFDIHVPQP
jgi:CLIP-associating protein 1/2